MRYQEIKSATFLKRPNRFIAYVSVDGKEEAAHVKNTGRCRELLVPGAEVFLECHQGGRRRTKYSLIAVKKENRLLINMDSQAPNKVVAEWLKEKEPFGPIRFLKAECRHGASRFDFYLETDAQRMFIEVKGVTLEEEGLALFPDAPTERGVRHLRELCACLEEGYAAAVIFVIQMEGMRLFTPNVRTHPEFAQTLRQAAGAGVRVLAYSCAVTPATLAIAAPLPVQL